VRVDRAGETATEAAVAVVEDHAMVAASLAAALRAHGLTSVVVTSEPVTAPAVLAAVAGVGAAPPVVLLDLDLGGGIDGAELVEPLTRAGARVVVLSGSSDRIRLAGCVAQGAVGLVCKSEPLEQLVATVAQVARGGTALTSRERDRLLAELRAGRAEKKARLAPFVRLTRRERDVLRSLVEGLTADEIAAQWCVAVGTVRSQIHAVLGKLDVHTQQAAIALAWQAGWAAGDDALDRHGAGNTCGGEGSSRPEIYKVVDDGRRPGRDPEIQHRALAPVLDLAASGIHAERSAAILPEPGARASAMLHALAVRDRRFGGRR